MFFYVTKNPTPQQLALQTAVNIAVVTAVLLGVIKIFFVDTMAWWVVITMPIFVTIFAYFAVLESLRRFIYRKVKLIYKSIHSIKAPKSSPPLAVDLKEHIIDQVEREVVEWAKDWAYQIQYLKKLEEYRRDFIGNISHELKTPIFNMQGYLYTLLDGGWEDEQISMKYLRRAADNVERIASIVQDLGLIAKLEDDKLELDASPFNIAVLAKEIMDDMELHASKKSIQIEFKEKNIPQFIVNADREMIRQVFTNLISNSIKYGKEGGKTLVGFYDLDQNILIEVSDDGRGISQEHLPRLFERFYRVDKGRSRQEGGTGLGLSIVKHIIEAHNQTVNVRSRFGEGSTFGFTLEKVK